MTSKTLTEMLALLEGKHLMNGRRQEDWKRVVAVYISGLEHMSDKTARYVIPELLITQKWVPDVSEIWASAARYESPTPSEDDAWSEVFAKCGMVNPSAWSHALVARAVADLGGADVVWHELQYANGGVGTPVSIVGAQFRKAYERRRAEWESEVMQALRQPIVLRDENQKALFPVAPGTKFHKFAEPTQRQLRAIEARQEERIETPALDVEDIKAMLKDWRKNLRAQSVDTSEASS